MFAWPQARVRKHPRLVQSQAVCLPGHSRAHRWSRHCTSLWDTLYTIASLSFFLIIFIYLFIYFSFIFISWRLITLLHLFHWKPHPVFSVGT